MSRSSALAEVVARVRATGADVVLIGAVALAGHGVARSTGDIDLLCADARGLEEAAWRRPGALRVDLRRGDVDDPLDAVLRARIGRGRPVDVVFLTRRWAVDLVARARSRPKVLLQGVALAVPDAADLLLLKLYAGGPRDLDDARALLAVAPPDTASALTSRLGSGPESARRAWAALPPP